MDYIEINHVKISRFIIGSNPFSGFSHQSPEMDLGMKRFFTTEKIKDTLHEAESLGITTAIARTDYHIIRMFLEYWDQGGKIQWFAQTCPEAGSHKDCVSRAAAGGAKACHIHGGVMDLLLAQNKLDEIKPVVKMIQNNGMLAGIAGHNPNVFKWAENNLNVDYYMCSYYNPTPRDEKAEHVPGAKEQFLEQDRRMMTNLIKKLSKPVIHYKILAAGRNNPEDAFAYTAGCMRATDCICVGVFTKNKPDMLKEDISLFEKALLAEKATDKER